MSSTSNQYCVALGEVFQLKVGVAWYVFPVGDVSVGAGGDNTVKLIHEPHVLPTELLAWTFQRYGFAARLVPGASEHAVPEHTREEL
jgi:hypothetical protein